MSLAALHRRNLHVIRCHCCCVLFLCAHMSTINAINHKCLKFGGVQLLSHNFWGCPDTHVTHYCCAYAFTRAPVESDKSPAFSEFFRQHIYLASLSSLCIQTICISSKSAGHNTKLFHCDSHRNLTDSIIIKLCTLCSIQY